MGVRIISRLQRLLQLPAAERRLLLEALGLHWAFRAGLGLVPFRKLSGLATGLGEGRLRTSAATPAESVVWAVSATSPFTPRVTCLTRSLTLQAMLRRRGRPALLRIGVAKPSGEPLEAHAWVELEGQVYLGGPELERFEPMSEPNGAP
jgi:hypothetical protein